MQKEYGVKIKTNDFPVQSPGYSDNAICLTPGDIETAQEINKQMRKISHKAKYRFGLSVELSQGLILKKTKVHE